MKKLFVSTFLLFSTVLSFADAKESQLFVSPDAEVAAEMSELTAIEIQLNKNPELQMEDIKSSGLGMAMGSNLASSARLMPDEKALGIPSFIWGCGLGIAGVAVVYFVTEDTDQTKKALWGCLASGAALTVLYVVAFAASASTY